MPDYAADTDTDCRFDISPFRRFTSSSFIDIALHYAAVSLLRCRHAFDAHFLLIIFA